MLFRILGPKGHLIIRRIAAVNLRNAIPGLVKRFHRVQVVAYPTAPKPSPAPQPITMYDDTSDGLVPLNAAAVAGYVNGRYANWLDVVKRFPHAYKLSIAVSSDADADCLDVENGDATPGQAPTWVQRQRKRGSKRIVVYGSVSAWPSIEAAFKAQGVSLVGVKRWTAHYTYKPHRCTSICDSRFTGTADATQWTDKALGRSLDASLCAPNFFV